MVIQAARHANPPSYRWYEHSGVMDEGRLTTLSLDMVRADGPLRRALDDSGVDAHDRRVLDRAATELEAVASAIDRWAQLHSSRIWRASTLGILVGICTDMDAGADSATDVSHRMRGVASQLRSDINSLDATTVQELIQWISGLSAGIHASRSVVPCVTILMGDGLGRASPVSH